VRRRVTAALLGTLLTSQFTIGAGMAGAQPVPSDTSATGELLGGGGGAAVTADFQPNGNGNGGGGGGGGGRGDNSGITCRLTFATGAGSRSDDLSGEELQAAYDQQVGAGRSSVAVVRICSDEQGTIVSTELIDWAPGTPVQVDPAALAEMAREWLVFPVPSGETSPPLATGTVAQLPTYVAIDNWAAVSRTATAGPVTATVIATPARQTWRVGGEVVVECDGPGVLVEAGATAPPEACAWTPEHSSAGQPTRSESGEPCFDVTITLTWDVRWTSTGAGGAGGPLDDGTRSSRTCIVVAEVQAVVSGER
jgi:hypothetical protein